MKEREIIVNAIDSENQPRNSHTSDLHRRVAARNSGRRQRSNKNSMPPKQKKFMTAIIIISIIAIIALIAWGISGFMNRSLTHTEGNVLVDDLVEDKVSILLVGADGGGYNTDTIMLAMMDCKTHSLSIMSIPRDTRVPNPYGGSGYSKINSVYTAQGMDGLIEQVGKITGLPINFYVKVDFEGFREIIDILGGVYFDVPQRLKYSAPDQNFYIDLYPGYQLLDGNKAEQLVRSRNQYPEADLARTDVQRDFIKAVIAQHATPANLLKVGDLYSAMTKYVTTNITMGDALKYATSLTQIPDENIQMFRLPGVADSSSGPSYYLYNSTEMEQLAHDVFWHDVEIRPTPRPQRKPEVTSTPTVSPSSTPVASPSSSPTASPDDDGTPTTSRPTTSPTTSSKPTASPSVKPSSSPSVTSKPTTPSTPTPSATPAKTPTPSTAPGDYPDGI